MEGLSWAASLAGLTLTVLVECDTGAARCGVQTPESAAALARKIVKLPGLHFGGLMTFPTADQSDAFIAATKALLRMDGIPVERVSGGGTPCMWQAHTHPEINEHRAGTYVFGDRHTLKSGAMQLEECAFHVVTTVVSRPTAQRGVLDAGSKCLSSDGMGLEGYGLILEYPQAVIYALSEEHGHVDFSRCARKPAIGERLSILPNHCCPVTNLFDQVIGVRRGKVEVVWPVACRGAVQ